MLNSIDCHNSAYLLYVLWNGDDLKGRLFTNNIPKIHEHYDVAVELENDWEFLDNWLDENKDDCIQKSYNAVIDVYRSLIIPHNEPVFEDDEHTFHQTMCRMMLRFLLCAFDTSNDYGKENVQQIINDYIAYQKDETY